MISAVIIDMNRTSWTQMAMAMATSVTTVRQWQIPGKRSIATKVKTGDTYFLSLIEPMCTHPPQGFCKIWAMKGEIQVEKGVVIWFFLRGLDLVRESATSPTHIWKKSPKKNVFYLNAFP